MKNCPSCGTQLNDDCAFCAVCGTPVPVAAQPAPQQPPVSQGVPQYGVPVMPVVDPYDHTAEFDAQDISDNKVFAMLCYLLGIFGIALCMLSNNTSKYLAFHVRQAVKITVTLALGALASALLFWTFIVPIAYAILSIVLLVIRIICFFQIAGGKAKEPAIIRSLSFLK